MPNSNNRVVPMVQSGSASRQAFLNRLFNAHSEALRRFLRTWMVQEADIDDLVQEIFLRLSGMTDLERRFAGRSESVRSYLFSIAANLLHDQARRDKSRRADHHQSYQSHIDDHQTTGITLEEQLLARRELAIMDKALMQLTPAQRKAFVFSRFKCLSYAEIAEDMGVSVSTVEKHIATALAYLREKVL